MLNIRNGAVAGRLNRCCRWKIESVLRTDYGSARQLESGIGAGPLSQDSGTSPLFRPAWWELNLAAKPINRPILKYPLNEIAISYAIYCKVVAYW